VDLPVERGLADVDDQVDQGDHQKQAAEREAVTLR
jgi:hypothetical protein